MTPHLLEVGVESQLLLVGRFHLGSISDEPDGFLEPVFDAFVSHDVQVLIADLDVWETSRGAKAPGEVMRSAGFRCSIRLICPRKFPT
jgi:hypothetical protein